MSGIVHSCDLTFFVYSNLYLGMLHLHMYIELVTSKYTVLARFGFN